MPNNPLLARLRGWTSRTLLVALIAGNAAVVRAEAPAGKPAEAQASASAATQPSVVDIRRSVEFLSSPALEGRGPGTPGIDLAAGYIAGKFQQMGLQPPPGWDSYFQQFNMTTETNVDPATSLATADGSKAVDAALKLNETFQPLSFSSEGQFNAPLVFAGYGVADKKQNYDDYADLDVKGKVVLAMRFEPFDKDGNSAFTGKKDDYSENASIPVKAKLAADKGAVALILVNPPNVEKEDRITPFAKQLQFQRASIPVIQVKRPVADALLAAGKLPALEELQKKINADAKPASAPVEGVKLAGDVKFKKTEKSVRNVAAVLPGKGPNAGEYVVIGAHYDHLGKGGRGSLAPFSRDVHHGADDNASGTTAVLKLAEHFAKAGPQDRSLLFVGFTAEEMGLIGSDHFVRNSPVEMGKVAAMINFDMVGRLRDGNLQIGGSGTAASFDKILTTAAEGSDLKLNLKSKGGMGPSDHMSFAKNKVPVLFFFTGVHADYHRPTDTADKVNYEGIRQIVDLGAKVIDEIASMPREQYVATHDAGGMHVMGSGNTGATRGSRVSLGVIPDYGDDTLKGVRITGTTPGSAAEKAGLKDGDILVAWNDTKLENLMDLMGTLGKGKPGETVKIKVLRDGKEVVLDATLTERK